MKTPLRLLSLFLAATALSGLARAGGGPLTYHVRTNGSDTACSGLFDSTSQARTLSIIGYVVAGALAGGSAALLLPGKSAEGAESAMACTAGFGPSLLSCRLSF